MCKTFEITRIIVIALFVLILITLFCSLLPNGVAQQLSFLFGIPVGSIATFKIIDVLTGATKKKGEENER